MTDILSQLPYLQFRNVIVPCEANDLAFSHGSVRHGQFGTSGELIEPTGRVSATMKFRIPFRTGISFPVSPKPLFPDTFKDFWNACLDGTPGTLLHPAFGVLQAAPGSFTVAFDPMKRDGYDVDVEFIESVDEEAALDEANPIGPIKVARQLASDFDKIKGTIDPEPEYDDGKTTDLLTAMKQLEGFIDLAQMSFQDCLGRLNAAIDAINSMIDALDKATGAPEQAVNDVLRALEAALQDTKETLSPSKKRVEYVVAEKDVAVPTAADRTGMALDEFYKMNPKYAGKQNILAGQEYFYVAAT
jgi:hypothetical protein